VNDAAKRQDAHPASAMRNEPNLFDNASRLET
jgi:hypothetical protein